MNMPWLEAIHASLRRRLAADALPHAILMAGARGLGKRALADRITAAVLCQAPVDGMACAQCRACSLHAAGTHPDLHRVALELNTQGRLRREILVGQVRELSRQLAMTSQLGGRQLAVIDPADAMNREAANALLKTLEEPTPATVLLLVADHPWRLPATIRSRCQTFTVPQPPHAQALAWLQQVGVTAADEALAAAGGNPGLARSLEADGLLPLRDEVATDLAELARGQADVGSVSARWDDEHAVQRLRFAARIVADELRQRAGAGQRAVAPSRDAMSLLDWYRAAVRAAEDLRGPLRPRLVLHELLARWA